MTGGGGEGDHVVHPYEGWRHIYILRGTPEDEDDEIRRPTEVGG